MENNINTSQYSELHKQKPLYSHVTLCKSSVLNNLFFTYNLLSIYKLVPCHLSSFNQCSVELISLREQLVYSDMESVFILLLH